MSNYKAITGSSKIVHRNQGGGSKLQGIASSTNLNTWEHVAFRNRNVVCPCNRDIIFCMNQLGGVGAGGIPGRSYAFAPTADGTHKPFYCGHRFNYHLDNNKHLIKPKKYLNEYTELYSNVHLYIQNLATWASSNTTIYDKNQILKVDNIYKITFSNINTNITFKVTTRSNSSTYKITILSQYNFPVGSSIYYNIGSNLMTTNTNSFQYDGEIIIYKKN